MSIIYDIGTISIKNGASKVYGENTDWLYGHIKAHDLFLGGGDFYEIAEINSNTEITLTRSYTGASIEKGAYQIFRTAEQVIASRVALNVQKLVDSYEAREKDLGEKIDRIAKAAEIILKSGLYIDSDGDLAQDDSPDKSSAGNDYSSPDSDSEGVSNDTAEDDEVDEIIDKILE